MPKTLHNYRAPKLLYIIIHMRVSIGIRKRPEKKINYFLDRSQERVIFSVLGKKPENRIKE